MIYVECKPDFALVKSVTRIPRREIIHERDKSRVCHRLKRRRSCKGLVDEDPSHAQPRYIRELKLQNDLPEDLRVLFDEQGDNHLIILCPTLEAWILKAAKQAGLNVQQYGLPSTPEKLHRVINLDLDKFEKLLEDVKNSKRLKALRGLLET